MKKSIKHLSAGLMMSASNSQDTVVCFIEYFPKEKRYFLSSLKSSKDLKIKNSDEFIVDNLSNKNLESIIINIPISKNLVDRCYSECEKAKFCCKDKIFKINKIIEKQKETASGSLLKKLKKGFVPYSQREIDLWVTMEYHDEFMKYFKSSWDVFSRQYSILFSRLRYLWGELPSSIINESHYLLCLIELRKSQIVGTRHLFDLSRSSTASLARRHILKELEKKMNLFIYKNDFDIMIKNPKAFQAMLLALTGQLKIQKRLRKVPEWTGEGYLAIPDFDL